MLRLYVHHEATTTSIDHTCVIAVEVATNSGSVDSERAIQRPPAATLPKSALVSDLKKV